MMMMANVLLLVLVVIAAMLRPCRGATRHNPVELAAESDGIHLNKRNTDSNLSRRLQLPADVGLTREDTMMSAQGNQVTRFQETYKGIQVYDTVVDTEDEGTQPGDSDQEVVSGQLIFGLEDDLNNSLSCRLPNAQATRITLKHMGLDGDHVSAKSFQVMIYVDKNDTAHFATKVSLLVSTDEGKIHRSYAFIDRCSKEVLEAVDMSGTATRWNYDKQSTDQAADPIPRPSFLMPPKGWDVPSRHKREVPTTPPVETCEVSGKGGNPKRVIQYGSRPYCLSPLIKSADGKTCYLQNNDVSVINLKGSERLYISEAVSFPCTYGYPDETKGAYNTTLDAFYFGTQSVKMYRDWYDYNPRVYSGPLRLLVHYGKEYFNAFWMSGVGLVFGDAYGEYNPLVVLDVVAHELGHAIIEKTSHLEYSDMPGGINEAFADMAGQVTEVFTYGQTDYLVGSEIYKTRGTALRYMDQPTRDGSSIQHVNKFTKRMDVHHSSGIFNHAFWLMAVQQKMGARAAFECFLNANRLFWTPKSDFEHGACGVIRGAYISGYDMDVVANSFQAVGITRRDCPDLSKLVSAILTPGVISSGLRVSKVNNALFKMEVPVDKSVVTVRASHELKFTVSQSYQRSTSLPSYWRGSSVPVTPGSTLYIRLFNIIDQLQTGVSVKATLS